MSKQNIELIAGNQTYESLATFNTVDELNKAVRLHIEGNSLNKTELAVLELLKRYSCRFFGVSFLRKTAIGEMVGKSRRTIIRVCKRLEDLGIIRQYEVKRASDMQQTSNAIVIQAVSQTEVQAEPSFVTQESAESVTPRKATSSLKQNTKPKERNAAREDDEQFDYSYVSSSLPSEFVGEIGPRLGRAKAVYRMWGRLKLAAGKAGISDHIDEHIADYVKAFKEALYIYKSRNLRTDIYGYMYGAWRNTAAVLARRKYARISWLAD